MNWPDGSVMLLEHFSPLAQEWIDFLLKQGWSREEALHMASGVYGRMSPNYHGLGVLMRVASRLVPESRMWLHYHIKAVSMGAYDDY